MEQFRHLDNPNESITESLYLTRNKVLRRTSINGRNKVLRRTSINGRNKVLRRTSINVRTYQHEKTKINKGGT
jgi:hypothetical protein